MEQNRFWNRWLAIATLVISGFVYLITISPDVSFWDCGEFIACSYTMSVMHPPGAPLFTILGRLFTLFPVGNIAWRMNFMSVIASAVTVMLLYLIIVRLINEYRGQPKTSMDRILTFGSAFIGALTFAFTDSHWFNAEEAEVYGMSILFTALVVWLILYWGDYSEDVKAERFLLLIVYLMGLATGVHLLNLLAFPFILLVIHFRKDESAKLLVWTLLVQVSVPIFFYILFFHYNPDTMGYEEFIAHQNKAGNFFFIFGLLLTIASLAYLYSKDRRAFKLWWFIPALMFIGYSSYLILYIRSGLNPPIDENDPGILKNMMDYLARKQYGEQSLLLTIFSRKAEFWSYQIKKMYIRYFAWQFVGRGTTLGSDGYIVETWSLKGLFMLPFMVGMVGAYHHFRRDWKHALAVLVFFFITGLAIIFYLNQENPQPRERDYAYVGSFFAFAIWIGIGVYALIELLRQFFAKHPQLFKPLTWSSLAALTVILPVNMFLFNYDSHDRSGNYVPYDYSYNILETCEPNAIIFTNGDNDTFPLWYLQFVKMVRPDIRLVNLSLLNTSWYIHQLKDQEPKVPISLTDSQIEQLGIYPWEKTRTIEFTVPPAAYTKERQAMQKSDEWQQDLPEPSSIKIKVEPTLGRPKQALRVQDLMVLNIVAANQWRKPIYFAVTVSDDNKVGLQEYLRMDGMAFKLVPYPNLEISPAKLHDNLFNKFLFRNLNNPNVYLDDKTSGLLINYRSAFLRLADYYRGRKENKMVLQILDRMENLIPENVIPIGDNRLLLSIGKMYEDAGRPEEFEHRLKEVIARNPEQIDAYIWLLSYYRNHQMYQPAMDLMTQWLELHPNDQNAKQILDEMKRQQVAKDSAKTPSLPQK